MKASVTTFGGAVTHLKRTFETFDFLNNKEQITKYVEDNPNDVKTRQAWNTYAEVMRNIEKEKVMKVPYYRYIWIARDKTTGKRYTTSSALALGMQIGASKSSVIRWCKRGEMWDNRYKHELEPNAKGERKSGIKQPFSSHR